MPIDPNIANAMMNPKQFQMPDPMDGMGKALTNALMMEKMRGLGDERAMNNALNEAYRTAGTDRTKLVSALIDKGQGRHAPDVMKKWYEVDETQAKAAKGNADAIETESKAVAKEFENARSLWAGVTTADPAVGTQQALGVVDAQFKNPVLSKWYASMNLTPEVMKQGIQQAAQQGQLDAVVRGMGMGMKDALEQHYQLIQEKDKQTLVGVNKYGAPNPTVAGTYGAKPMAAGTTVNVNGEKAVSEFDKAVGKALGEEFVELKKAAQSAPAMIADVDRALGILNTGNVILGAGSQTLLDIARVAKAMGMPIENESMVNTEELSKFFAGNTLANIARFKQMGVSLTPMSDSDRRLIEQASAQGSNDPATIRRLLMLQRKMAEESINKYNEMAQRYTSNPATAPGQTALSTATVPAPPGAPGRVTPPPNVPAAPGVAAAIKAHSSEEGFKKNVAALKAKQVTPAEFDAYYGVPGAAAQILGGTPNGGNPFP